MSFATFARPQRQAQPNNLTCDTAQGHEGVDVTADESLEVLAMSERTPVA